MQSLTFPQTDVDVMNRSARLRAGVIALVLSIASMFVAYFVTKSIVAPETIHHNSVGYQSLPYQNAWRMIYATTSVAGVVVFYAARAIAMRALRR
jgi:hypothetical protein